jgi:hypothetical protein
MTRYDDAMRLKRAPRNWANSGAAGFIGSNWLEMLLKLDQRVAEMLTKGRFLGQSQSDETRSRKITNMG